jgi:hypothetical protein
MTSRVLLAASLILVSSAAVAFADEDLDHLASNLGKVLGSEVGCGLTYDQPAIEHLIELRVPASSHGFADDLELSSSVAGHEFEDLTTSQKTARCALVKRTAKDYGILK